MATAPGLRLSMPHAHRACALAARLGGPDLSAYKEGVLVRRLRSRARALGLEGVGAYLDRLEAGGAAARIELAHLARSLSVQVSAFFRDPDVFRHLADDILPVLLQEAGVGGAVRLWSAACAQGQEAYSLAIALLRQPRARRQGLDLSVLGTDVDEAAVAAARAGVYAARLLKGLPPDALAEAFEPLTGGRAAVRGEVRRLMRFERADLLDFETYPAGLDLISCRNLLIYLRRDVQEDVLVALAGALRPGGFLVLGQGETMLGRPWTLFDHVSPSHRVYRKPP